MDAPRMQMVPPHVYKLPLEKKRQYGAENFGIIGVEKMNDLQVMDEMKAQAERNKLAATPGAGTPTPSQPAPTDVPPPFDEDGPDDLPPPFVEQDDLGGFEDPAFGGGQGETLQKPPANPAPEDRFETSAERDANVLGGMADLGTNFRHPEEAEYLYNPVNKLFYTATPNLRTRNDLSAVLGTLTEEQRKRLVT